MVPGSIIGGKYRLVRQIGEGAMGVVWAAVNELTSGEVALKLVLQSTEDLRLRLLREARVCGGLKHRNVIEVHDVGQTEEGDPFLVMQLLSGETLAEHLKRQRRLDPPAAARIARDVARALAAAHAAGVIHRDLKPANIFLHHEAGADGATVKVLDFGVSKSLEMSDGLVTTDGGAIGSPAYMSPEQARADRTLDHRADIWSLGVVLFELLAGVRPFLGDSNQVIPRIIMGDIPLVSRHVRLVDPALVNLVSRCLERDCARRIGSAAELAELLQRHVSPTQSTPDASAAAQVLGAPGEQGETRKASEALTTPIDPKRLSASLATGNAVDGEIDRQAPYWWRRAGRVGSFSGTSVLDGETDLKTDIGPAVTTVAPPPTAAVPLLATVAAPRPSALGARALLSALERLLVGRKALLALAAGGAALLAVGIGAYEARGGASMGVVDAPTPERPSQPARESAPPVSAPSFVVSPPPAPTVVIVAPPVTSVVKPAVKKPEAPRGVPKDKPRAPVSTPSPKKPSWLN